MIADTGFLQRVTKARTIGALNWIGYSRMADPQTVALTCHYMGFCAIKNADQAAWASAIGSIGAAIVALGIALSGGVVRWLQRRRDGRALAAYIAADVDRVCVALDRAATYIEEILCGNADFLMRADLMGFAATNTADLGGGVLEAKVDRFGLLPGRMGQELAGAVGSLDVCRADVGRFAIGIRQTVPGRWKDFSQPILDRLRRSRKTFERTRRYCVRATK